MTNLAPLAYDVGTGDLLYDDGSGFVTIPYTGPMGPAGPTGPGVVVGGATNQVLKKNSATNYDCSWGSVSGNGSWVNIDDFGAVGNGTTNDSAALALAQAALPNGGVIRLTAGSDYYFTSFALNAGVVIEGPGVAGGMHVYDASWCASLTKILISGTITLSSRSGLQGLTVVPYGMSFPQLTPAAWTGTAITTNTGVNVLDVFLKDTIVMGFNLGFEGINCPRVHMEKAMFDCVNGVKIDNAGDCIRLEKVHCWPFATVSGGVGSTNIRLGRAFELLNNTDGGTLSECFSSGWNTGFYISGMNGLRLIACGAEAAAGASGQNGYQIEGTSQNIELVACQGNGLQNSVVVNIVPNDIHKIVSVNGGLWGAAADSHMRVFSGTCAVRNAFLQSCYSHASLIGTGSRLIIQNNTYYGNSGPTLRYDAGALPAQTLSNTGNVNI